ncbi:restriction endonuclease subunit S [Anatilimnocola floriformis]|uniref:restriction endonuclease subunit S n=1 Tax=Anatilimnocola floriformis TaxID=2948575 RepID=UPI0020C34F53|nr:restriction endonuclease subunit S [Anatilimnocola floriformis]
MTKWPMVPLGEVLTQVTTATKVQADRDYANFGIYSFGRGLFAKSPISGTTTSASNLYQVRAGQFIYSRLFAFEGAYGLVGEEFDGCFISNEYPHFDSDPKRITPAFLATYFKWQKAWEQAAKLSTGMGDRRRRIQPEQLLKMTIPLPPLKEQQRLIEYLDALTAKCEEAKAETTVVQHESNKLLLSAFLQITEGMPRSRLGDIAPLVRRPMLVDPFAEYPGVSVRSFGKGTFHTAPVLGSEITWEKPHLVRRGDLLISNIKAWEGAIAVAGPGDDGRFGSHRYLTYVPQVGIVTPRFLCFYLLTADGLQQVSEVSPGSADRNRTTSAKGLLEIPVPLPKYPRQVWFGELFDKVQEVKTLQTHAIEERESLLPTIIAQVFTGDAA